jgi:beta-galactosidase
MKLRQSNYSWLILIFIFTFIQSTAQSQPKRNNLFDFGWRFHRGGALGAEEPAYDDSQWRMIDLPHDWSIEDLPGTTSPFNIDAVSQVSGGFTTGGTGWYRKTFKIPAEYKEKQLIILFEGVYMNAEVWLNGEFLGNHPYGYTSFWFDISGKVKFEKENVLCVKVKNEGENSRWYSGSGIYRHVWLNIVSPFHVATWGTYITTPHVSEQEALINIKTSLVNQSSKIANIKLVTKIFNSSGQEQSEVETGKVIEPGKTIEIVQEMKLNKPALWSTDSPVLYKAISEIHESEALTDQVETEFGIRSISFDAVKGFLLNGNPLKLRGGCVHHDNGILGSKAYDRAEERRVELLKASGFNAIRSSHNPPSPAFLNACDRLGMLVIDESFDMWKEEKNPNDYHLYFSDWWKKDIESMILRDRNHPSVILWSIGNEIPNRQKHEVVELAKTLGEFIRLIDPTRPITSAVNDLRPDKDPYFAALDVAGYNYASGGDHNQINLYEFDHERLPLRVMVGTESFPLEAFGSWMNVRDHPYVIGDFVWTAFDYIGEASIGWRGYFQKQDFFPWSLAFCGDLDICGWKRAQSYYRDALWKENQVSIWVTPPQPSFALNPERQLWSKWHWTDAVDDWNWKGSEGKIMDVNIYSSCGKVELFLNGKSLGEKVTDRSTKYLANWQVPYEPGTLRAVGFAGRKELAVAELHSSGEVTQIKLSADRNKIRSDGQDLSYITVDLTDNKGVCNRKAENQVSFEVEGPGTIAGVGNANPISLESFQLPKRKAWHGRCMVIIKSDKTAGKIILKATSAGLRPASLEIESN